MNRSLLTKFTLIAAAAALPFGLVFAEPNDSIKNGRKLFVDKGCYECHGYSGQGALLFGARIAQTELPLEAFKMILRGPISEMPPYEPAILSDADAAEILAYLQSVPASPDPNTLPLPRWSGK